MTPEREKLLRLVVAMPEEGVDIAKGSEPVALSHISIPYG